jgi:hypothetical protein
MIRSGNAQLGTSTDDGGADVHAIAGDTGNPTFVDVYEFFDEFEERVCVKSLSKTIY